MKRIDTINARANMFGVGKSGFHDNADLPGQDATYVSPEWFNTVQEELCNLLELRGITLDPASKRQLYDLLTTQADLEALADEIETNFIRKNQIVDNLTTDDASKVASAKQVKTLQDNKLEKSALNNTLSSDSTTQALTAAQGKVLNDQAFGVAQTWRDMKSSRVSGVTYTNTTGRAITVAIEVLSYEAETNTFVINGLTISSGDLGLAGMRNVITYVIPNGATYSLTCTGSSISKWLELR